MEPKYVLILDFCVGCLNINRRGEIRIQAK